MGPPRRPDLLRRLLPGSHDVGGGHGEGRLPADGQPERRLLRLSSRTRTTPIRARSTTSPRTVHRHPLRTRSPHRRWHGHQAGLRPDRRAGRQLSAHQECEPPRLLHLRTAVLQQPRQRRLLPPANTGSLPGRKRRLLPEQGHQRHPHRRCERRVEGQRQAEAERRLHRLLRFGDVHRVQRRVRARPEPVLSERSQLSRRQLADEQPQADRDLRGDTERGPDASRASTPVTTTTIGRTTRARSRAPAPPPSRS